MKLLIIALATLLSTSAFACTDFSGTFKDETGSVATFTQNGCDTLTVSQEQVSYTFINDGKSHLTLEQAVVVNGQTVGNDKMYSTMSFVDGTLVVDVSEIYVAIPGGETQTQSTHSVSSLNINGDLVSIETKNGETKTIINSRVY